MRATFNRIVVGVLALLAGVAPAAAQDCKLDDLHAVIDQTGQRLRVINTDWQPRLRAKLRELGQKRGWSETETDSRGRSVLDDDETRNLDSRAAELLAELHRLGDDENQKQSVCQRLDVARTKSSQLIEVSQQRAAHALARMDVALKPPTPAANASPAPVPTQIPTADASPRPAGVPERARAAPPPAPSPSSQPAQAAWDTRSSRDSQPLPPPPPGIDPLPIPPDPGQLAFSPEEIRAAGRGFFGSISAGLASVIDYAFQRFGRPTGYILGDEGGGAFLAGLRYGEGRLVTKQQGERKVYWQGPSAGFDFGLTGSQVMFLVYGVEEHQQLFQRFTGVDGSAYLVGGVGVTFLKRGKVILAPIRTGLGMRVGANVGYLKFTPSQSFNPF